MGRPENSMIGVMYGDWIWAAAPLQIAEPSSWIWAGTGATSQTTVAGLYQNESDLRFDNAQSPRDSPPWPTGPCSLTSARSIRRRRRCNTAPSGAHVFAAGSIGFSRTLAGPGTWDPTIQQLVANLFATFTGRDGAAPVEQLKIPSGAPPPEYRAGVAVTTVTRALTEPSAVAAAPDGTAVVVDGNRIVRVDAAGYVTTIAGNAGSGNVDGPAAQARFNSPRGVAVAPSGAIYVSDTGNNRIRVIRNGTASALAAGSRARMRGGSPTAAAARPASRSRWGSPSRPTGTCWSRIPGT